jgi:hypothetical protein
VKIASDVLNSKSTISEMDLRGWAVDVINKYSELKIPEPAKQRLINGETSLSGFRQDDQNVSATATGK